MLKRFGREKPRKAKAKCAQKKEKQDRPEGLSTEVIPGGRGSGQDRPGEPINQGGKDEKNG